MYLGCHLCDQTEPRVNVYTLPDSNIDGDHPRPAHAVFNHTAHLEVDL
jgi:hypothetical protein